MLYPIQKKHFSIGELYFVNEFEVQFLIYEIFHQLTYLSDFLTLHPDSVIVDVGANIGIFSLFAISQCNGNAQIYSFEPIPATFQCLEKNLASHKNIAKIYNEGISNVTNDCYRDFTLFGKDFATATYRKKDKLLSNYAPLLNYTTLLEITKTTNKTLYYQLKYLLFMRHYLVKKNYKKQTLETKVRCKLTSLSHFIETNQLNRIDFLKIDVEGAEMDVIKSIHPKQFSMIKQCSIEVHNIDNRVATLADFLREQGFSIKVCKNPMFESLGFNHHMVYAKKE
ncbi:FkbM family methyltransferase [Legionella oakridgensis]|uniref:Methoxymalonyl CoA synthase n=1 Tax=Legionella oakridgensis TaxID=29423 RepID=A0A0W0XD94_9GAMM|nr:FkbM family methyltransferase [Legionella oakridgensis]KTD42527.1 methoxymalonyl CoA synthase [Legionella oakridgensis]STY21098.1 methoxymalonyl CoA synthase [Legionella longbeachae]